MRKTFCAASIFLFSTALFALTVGQPITSPTLLDSNNKATTIPALGSKVLTIMYTDPDVKDVNDVLSNAIKAKNYSASKYQGIGIANCKDTWIPDVAIRKASRDKEKQFPGAIILVDENKILSSAWALGDCDSAGVVIIIGTDKKVKYVKKNKSSADSSASIAEVIKVLDAEMKK